MTRILLGLALVLILAEGVGCQTLLWVYPIPHARQLCAADGRMHWRRCVAG